VLDTNVLLTDPNALYAFEDNDVIVPIAVLEELDRHKNRQDEVGRCARSVARLLDDLRKSGQGSLLNGVTLKSSGTIRVVTLDPSQEYNLPIELQSTSKVDNFVIAYMLQNKQYILVSRDINVRLKCDALGITCQDYLKCKITNNLDELYTGVIVVNVDSVKIEEFYANKYLHLEEETYGKFYANQILILKDSSGSGSAVGRWCAEDKLVFPIEDIKHVFGLSPKNKEQMFVLDMLFDQEIKLVTMIAKAGAGKTLLSIAAGLEQLKSVGSRERYDKLIVTRPVMSLGKEIGFLPGTLREKMDPWIAPFKDNFNFLMSIKLENKRQRGNGKISRQDENYSYLDALIERGMIEIEALAFIRGRSIPNSFIIVDEAQNLSIHELKTIITRVGDNTKIVLTGDIDQIDNVNVDAYTNGLTYAVEKFKDSSIAGHVNLIKGERSKLATIASELL
jgi:PhoH-like ATPase